jgi:hypothetical protein
MPIAVISACLIILSAGLILNGYTSTSADTPFWIGLTTGVTLTMSFVAM